VGLTAGVHMDPMTKEWTLEGGALVRTQTRTVRLYARKVFIMYVR
jgi:DNA replicative helicase MCM subunit Mcm2 (Cdc46/Mcm family)